MCDSARMWPFRVPPRGFIKLMVERYMRTARNSWNRHMKRKPFQLHDFEFLAGLIHALSSLSCVIASIRSACLTARLDVVYMHVCVCVSSLRRLWTHWRTWESAPISCFWLISPPLKLSCVVPLLTFPKLIIFKHMCNANTKQFTDCEPLSYKAIFEFW